jgi:hypothetical protein
MYHWSCKLVTAGRNRIPTVPERLTINCFGNDTTLLKEFIEEAVTYSMSLEEDKVTYYEMHRFGAGWTKQLVKDARPLDSVILDGDITEKLISDIKMF